MLKYIKMVMVILVFGGAAVAQGGIGTTIRSYTSMPTTCTAGTDVTAGTVFLVNNILYSCFTDNHPRQASGPFSSNACVATSASGAAYTCSTSPAFTPVAGELMLFTTDVANTGPATLNVNSAGAKPLKKQGGATALISGDFRANESMLLLYDGINWQMLGQLANAPGSSILGPNPWYDMVANSAKGDGSSDNAAALNSVASSINAAARGNTVFFPANVSSGYFFNTKPGNFASGLNVKCPDNRGAAFGYGSILSPNYTAASATDGFFTWDGGNAASAGDGGGIYGCIVFKNSGTGGSALAFIGADSSHRAGHISIANDRLSGSGTYSHGVYVDGSAITGAGTQGIRDIFIDGLEIFQTTVDAMLLKNAAHFQAVNVLTSPTAGTADINVTGAAGSTSSSQGVLFSNTEVGGNVNGDYVNNFVFHGVTIGDYTITNNTTNSAYIGTINGNVTSTSTSTSNTLFGAVGGTITDTNKKLTYWTNKGAQLPIGPLRVVGGQVIVGADPGNVGAGDVSFVHDLIWNADGTGLIRMRPNNGSGAFSQICLTFDGFTSSPFCWDSSNGFTSTLRISGKAYSTASNCSSSASPAVCGSASAGSIAVPAGTNPTLVVNTTAVTANSQILLTEDQSLGTKLGVTCNVTLPTGASNVTARTAGTSFTAEVTGVFTTNPVCISYMVVN